MESHGLTVQKMERSHHTVVNVMLSLYWNDLEYNLEFVENIQCSMLMLIRSRTNNIVIDEINHVIRYMITEFPQYHLRTAFIE